MSSLLGASSSQPALAQGLSILPEHLRHDLQVYASPQKQGRLHSSIAITPDIYSPVIPTMQRGAAAAMDAVLGG